MFSAFVSSVWRIHGPSSTRVTVNFAIYLRTECTAKVSTDLNTLSCCVFIDNVACRLPLAAARVIPSFHVSVTVLINRFVMAAVKIRARILLGLRPGSPPSARTWTYVALMKALGLFAAH